LENPKSNPHVDGIVGSSQTKVTDLATSQMQKLVIQQPAVGPASGSTTPTTQSSDIHSVQMKTSRVLNNPERRKKERVRKVVGEIIKSQIRMLRGPRMRKGR
jgi:uncharacterized protein (UPF0261 family)